MEKKKKIALIGTVGVPSRYGGFETLAHYLVDELKEDYDFTVYCSAKSYKKEERVKEWNGAKLIYLPFNANGIQSIIYDIISIFHAIFFADVLLILGVSGCIILPFIRLISNKKIIVNIDGMEWRREKWNLPAKFFLKLSERFAVRYSHADITDNASIQRYTAIHYKTLSHLITYGGDHCKPEFIMPNDLERYPFLFGKYAFKVARIEPENKIHIVLEAFEFFDKYPIVIVGNWNGSEYGKVLKMKYENHHNIYLLDPIYDIQILNTLRSNCYVYLHGHSAGGTNPSLVEAMSLSLPIIAFDVSYNVDSTDNRAVYFKNAFHLVKILEKITPNQLDEIAKDMGYIASRRYTWSRIANAYHYLVTLLDTDYSKRSVHSKIKKLDKKLLLKEGLAHLHRPLHFYEKSPNQNHNVKKII